MLDVSNRVKKALFDKGWTQKKLCGEIDVTETGYKRMAENNTWKLETIEKIAQALEIPIIYFFEDSEKSMIAPGKNQTGDSYLREHVARLEKSFSSLSEQFNSQLSVKDTQIADLRESQKSLQRMLETVLGKSRGATFTQLSEEESFETMMGLYLQAGLGRFPDLLTKKPRRFEVLSPEKLVALRSF